MQMAFDTEREDIKKVHLSTLSELNVLKRADIASKCTKAGE